MNHCYWFNQST